MKDSQPKKMDNLAAVFPQKVVCIIQARMSSSRLPGKVLKEVCGMPMLKWVADRVAKSGTIHQVLVATTVNESDDRIAAFCAENTIECFRGSEYDVLDRYYQAALSVKADLIVRVTADCPFIDWTLLDDVVTRMIAEGSDFAANRLPPPYKRTFPIGLDVEAVTFTALEKAWKCANKPYEREHVMPFFYDPANHFRLTLLNADQDFSTMRWTVDTSEDLLFIRRMAKALDCRLDFRWQDALEVALAHPDWAAINAGVKHKSMDEVDNRSDLSIVNK